MLAETGGYAEIFLSIQQLHHIFVGKDLSCVFDGLLYEKGLRVFRVNWDMLIHKTMKIVLIHKRGHGLAVLIIAPGPEKTAVKCKEGVVEAVADSLNTSGTEDKALTS